MYAEKTATTGCCVLLEAFAFLDLVLLIEGTQHTQRGAGSIIEVTIADSFYARGPVGLLEKSSLPATTTPSYAELESVRLQGFWWNDDVAALRQKCLRARRLQQRARGSKAFEESRAFFTALKRELKTL